jgi:predicted PurR-regulated permease PerM
VASQRPNNEDEWSIDMKRLISKAIAPVLSWLQGLQIQRLMAVMLVGLLLLAPNVALADSGSNSLTEKVRQLVHQDDSQRPKTTGEWQQEAREVEGSPGERLENIAEESAEAVKDFGTLYPDTAERTANSQADLNVQGKVSNRT